MKIVTQKNEVIKVLLVDDDEDDFVNIRDLLLEARGSKYQVDWKSTYGAGLEAIKKSNYHVCFLDYYLGEKTGLDFLREAGKFTSCPIILLTGHGNIELDLQAMETGASDYLLKSQITSDALDRAIRYSVKHAADLEAIREREIQILRQDRLASIGLLASSLAHEIGTPLGIIRGRAELLAKKLSSNELVQQEMKVVTAQIDRVSKLVNSLLHLARGKNSENMAAVDLSAVIRDVLNLMSHEMDRKGISCSISGLHNTFVKGESGPLGQVILNLLVNSVHAIDEEQKLRPRKDHQIMVEVRQEENFIYVVISDTGVGIKEENLPHLFKPFFTTKEIGVGTGLGLATSLKIIQSWGGNIMVSSPSGHGAIFTIQLQNATRT